MPSMAVLPVRGQLRVSCATRDAVHSDVGFVLLGGPARAPKCSNPRLILLIANLRGGAKACAALQAYAAARMAESVLRGMAGESGVYEAAYVASSVTELPFFASKARRPAYEHFIVKL